MEKTIVATEAVRKFSELLNMIKFRGEHYVITRGGKPIASMGPLAAPPQEHTLGELKKLLKGIPSLGEEARAFEKDLAAIIRHQPLLPKARPWE